jgi:hypothetical protein
MNAPEQAEPINAADYGFSVDATAEENRIALQAAVDAAIAQGRQLALPCGDFHVAGAKEEP